MPAHSHRGLSTGPVEESVAVEDDLRNQRLPGRLPLLLRARLAVRERIPGWAGARCGVEPRTLAAVCVVLAVAVGFAVHHYWTGRPQAVAATTPTVTASVQPEPSAAAAAPPSPASLGTAHGSDPTGGPVVVDVAGDVLEPGVRTLPPGSRVADAIEAAGGPAPGAETEGINRARILTDGEHIRVGGPDEAGVSVSAGGAGSVAGVAADGLIRLNVATAQELEALPGVGPVLAGSIVSYREQHGHFTSVDQLLSVSGIGETRLADIRERVVL